MAWNERQIWHPPPAEPQVMAGTERLDHGLVAGGLAANVQAEEARPAEAMARMERLDDGLADNVQVYHAPKRLRLDVASTSNTADDALQGDTPQSTSLSILRHNIDVCAHYINFEHDTLKKLNSTMDLKELICLEETLLELASYPKCCEGTFYLSAFQVQDQVYLRYIESGSYRGAFASVHQMISNTLPTSTQGAVWSQVYNEEDIHHQSQQKLKHSQQKGRKFRPDMAYKRHMSEKDGCIKNKITSLVRDMKGTDDECQLLGMVVHTKYLGHQQVVDNNVSDRWYIHSFGSLEPCKTPLEELFRNYIVHSTPYKKQDVADLLQNRLPGYASLQEQCEALSLIPNYPKSKPKSFKFEHKLPALDKCPWSCRGKIIWARCFRKRVPALQDACSELCKQVAAEDVAMEETPDPMDHHEPQHPVDADQRPPPRQKSRRLTTAAIRRALQDEQFPAANMSTANSSLYDNYCSQLLQNGKLYWRYSTAVQDIFMMNDIDDTTGFFKPTDYIHCQRIAVETGDHYVCECSIYRELVVESEMAGLNVEDAEITCVHCRLLKQEINNVALPTTKLQQLFFSAKDHLDKVCVRCPSNKTAKFSVLVDDMCSFVHLTYMDRTKKNIISCQLHRCKISKGCKRAVSFLNHGEVCPHLMKMNEHYDEWKELLIPEDPSHPDEEENDQARIDMDEQQAEAIPDAQVIDANMCFDEESGLYTYKCRSTHPAVQHGTAELRSATADRMVLNDRNPECIPRIDGCLKGPKKIPPVPEGTCRCHAGWTDATFPDGVVEYVRSMKLYTMHAPVDIQVYKRLCLARKCEEPWDEGTSECIHVSTTDTCAGDEIGWYFIQTVTHGRQSFTGFCSTMTMLYNSVAESRAFMSPSVFIEWWFSWAANQKLDFRKPCSVCQTQPKVLGCDGTKIGIAFRHQHVTPIENSDTDNILQTPHRKFDRCFMFYRPGLDNAYVRMAREALHRLTNYYMGKNKQPLSQQAIQDMTRQVEQGLPPIGVPAFRRLNNNEVSLNERMALCNFFRILASDAPVSSILPFQYTQDLKTVIQHVRQVKTVDNGDQLFNTVLQKMRRYSPEMRELFAASAFAAQSRFGAPHPDVTKLLLFLIQRVVDLHGTSIAAEQAIPQNGTYNPPKYGRAYYFSPSGEKLRSVRQFSMDSMNKNQNHDDPPSNNEHCSKVFPQVGKKGTSYLFLWFCPLHGHCYGFHIIPGSEGRKDPAASLYTHLEHPPQKICYDFACGLEEYCLNRESGFYNNVQFSHDIFHGYSHKCCKVYDGSRLLGSEKINSEIAEQFNSFIQCIKYPARQMTQDHFVFFVQYFINIWNTKKAEKHRQKLRIALLCHE